MPLQPFQVLNDVVSLEELCNELAKLQKLVRYVINGQIDFENIRARSIKAENIEAKAITADEIAAQTITAAEILSNTITALQIAAETITANEIASNAITTDKLNAGAVTADKITVSELSAIAANLGTVTAGTIIGLLIKTALSGQRVEMDINGLRSVDASGKVRVHITPSGTFGVQGIDFQDEDENYMGTLFSNATNKLSLVGHSDLNLSSQTGQVKINGNHVESTYANYLTYDPGTKVLTLHAKDSTIISSVTIT